MNTGPMEMGCEGEGSMGGAATTRGTAGICVVTPHQ